MKGLPNLTSLKLTQSYGSVSDLALKDIIMSLEGIKNLQDLELALTKTDLEDEGALALSQAVSGSFAQLRALKL